MNTKVENTTAPVNTLTNDEKAKREAAPAAANADAGKAIAAAADTAPVKPADTPKPVQGTTTAPNPVKPISAAPTVTAGQPGSKANPLPTVTAPAPIGKPVNPTAPKLQGVATAAQGGTVKPKGNGKGGKPETNKLASTDNAAGELFLGYDLGRWPDWAAKFKPSKLDIEAFWALGLYKKFGTKNVLAGATYLAANSREINVYDVGACLAAVCGGGPDHKMNVVNQMAQPAGYVTLVKGTAKYQRPGSTTDKTATSYHIVLTNEGRAKVERSFNARNMKLPRHLAAPEKPAGK